MRNINRIYTCKKKVLVTEIYNSLRNNKRIKDN